MCRLSEDDDWIIIIGPHRAHQGGEITVSNQVGLNGIYHLQGCLDDLQRLVSV